MIREHLREQLIKAHPERDGAFRWRGDGVSRIEGLSDAVFGFALTMLVVSLGVPKTFDDLVRMLAGFPAFVATFSMLVLVWSAQYRFFRRYGLEDARTVRLNVVLLCLVVFFVYPLKFLFETFIAMWLGPVGWLLGAQPLVDQARAAWMSLKFSQWPLLMVVFAIAYFGIFGVFALMHRHALRCADELGLDALEREETRFEILQNVVNMGTATLSVVVTFVVAYGLGPAGDFVAKTGGMEGLGAMLGGFVYMFTGPFVWLAGRSHRRRRAELLAARRAAPSAEALAT